MSHGIKWSLLCIHSTPVYWVWLILAKVLPVNYFSPESTMGIVPGIYWMNAFNKYLMSSVLSAGEIRVPSKHLTLSKYRKYTPTRTVCMLDVHCIPMTCSVLEWGHRMAVSARDGVPGLMRGTAGLEQSRKISSNRCMPKYSTWALKLRRFHMWT